MVCAHLDGGGATIQNAHDLACLPFNMKGVVQVKQVPKDVNADSPAQKEAATYASHRSLEHRKEAEKGELMWSAMAAHLQQ
eukprot:1150333-Pelagomonas_calceolata.AAC.8